MLVQLFRSPSCLMKLLKTCIRILDLHILGVKCLDFLTFISLLCWTLIFEMFALDPETKSWLNDHKHSVFGFPSLVRFSWGTCTSYSKNIVDVLWESDANDESGSSERTSRRQLKLTNIGFTTLKRKSEDIESSAKGRCKFFQARKLELISHF